MEFAWGGQLDSIRLEARPSSPASDLVGRLTQDYSQLVEAVAVIVTQLTDFGIVWVGRHLVLDRWLFK